jgi:hypothetical protein
LLATAAAAASALSLAQPASAKEYHVYNCHRPDGTDVAAPDWKPMGGDGNVKLPEPSNCEKNSFIYWSMGTQGPTLSGSAGYGLSLPDGLKATSIEGERAVWLLTGDDQGATIDYRLFGGDGWTPGGGDVRDNCRWSSGCSGWAWDQSWAPTAKISKVFNPPVPFIGFSLSCQQELLWGTCGGSGNQRGHVMIYRLDITVDDAVAPVAGAVTGALVQEGPRSGKAPLSVSATDQGSGIYEAYLMVDGVEIERTRPDLQNRFCNDIGPRADRLEFDRAQPCARAAQANFTFDTRLHKDGGHRVEVWVRDAADNRTKALDRNITIDNVPPPAVSIKPSITGGAPVGGLRPGDSVASQNGVWNGAGIAFSQRWQRSTVAGTWVDIPNATGGVYFVGKDDVGASLRVVVTARNADGATEAASEATGKVSDGKTTEVAGTKPVISPDPPAANGGGGNPATGQLVVDREQRTVDVKHGAKVVITGRLVDAEGNPIADASVDVYEQIAVVAAPWSKVDTVKTDSQGGYVYRPKTTSSRRLRFGFSQLRGDATYRATREVFVSITAGMTIKARSKVVRRRGLIRIDGQVVVDRLPTAGAVVEVQVLDAGMWRTVATRRANKDGKWSFKHRLREASATRFTFRSRLRVAGDLPSAEAKSAPIKVRVR